MLYPAELRGRRVGNLGIGRGSAADAIVTEIIGIALRLFGTFLRPDNRVGEILLGCERDRLLHRIEAQPHLVQRVFRARPSHQRVGLASARRFIGEHPPSRPRAGLHRCLCWFEDSRLRHRRALPIE